jgi:riboflavin synthase
MFTGIIECAGEVSRIDIGSDGARLVLSAPAIAADARLGDSVAVNGVCLTVVANDGRELAFDAVQETLRRSSLGELKEGSRVNLERPLRADGRFDGHIVQGHVDTTARLVRVSREGESHRLRFGLEPAMLRYVVEKGSITVDGISLTVAAVGADWFEVVIIPHTWEVTNLSSKGEGAAVNIEVDVLAKYVERMLAGRAAT